MRLPAEWERQQAVLLSWPHENTDWKDILDEVTECFINIVLSILKYAHVIIVAPSAEIPRKMLEMRSSNKTDLSKIHYFSVATNDTWARDFGMICTIENDIVFANDFKFNGWGLKFPACFDNCINRAIFPKKTNAVYINRLNFVLEGGSIDVDGVKTLMTTTECLLSPNRNGEFCKREIERRLRGFFGIERVIWLEHGALEGDDTDSHIDTLARFLPEGMIAYSSCDRTSDSHYHELKLMEEELSLLNEYKLLALPIPNPIFDESGNRLPATYANFLIINRGVLVPVYGDSHYDKIAVSRLKNTLPDYDIIPIDCRALIKQHGSLHCVTMQIPEGVFDL